ncbi:MAG TPA: hypothetical protein VN478_03510, partial [Clostridia bacterium]|nr:hypothetical protein [Clostridia bacterium]
MSRGFLPLTVGAVLACACGTVGAAVAVAGSLAAGCSGLRPRLWDWVAFGVVATGEDAACGTVGAATAVAGSLAAGCSGLRPRLWDWAPLGVVVEGDWDCPGERSPRGVTAGVCWGFGSE